MTSVHNQELNSVGSQDTSLGQLELEPRAPYLELELRALGVCTQSTVPGVSMETRAPYLES